jgi:hypothetical protein
MMDEYDPLEGRSSLRSSVKKGINYCWSDIVVGEQVMRNENIFF